MRLAALLALFALPAAAQGVGTYAVFATQAELDDGGTLAGAVPTCLLAGASGDAAGAFFWDATSEQFALYDASAAPGERTTVPVPAFLIDIAAGTDVTTCRDATPELDPDGAPTGVVFLVLSNANNKDFVARVDAATNGFSVLTDRGSSTDSGDGISGLAQIGTTLYLARQQVFGAPEDGIYVIDTTTEGQVPTPLVVDADLDLASISALAHPIGDEPYLYAVSSEFGSGAYQNVILQVGRGDAPELVVALAPCLGPEPVFTDCTDGGLEEISLGYYPIDDVIYVQALVFNNSFSGPQGETLAAFPIGPLANGLASVQFAEAALVAETGVSGYTPSAPTGYMTYFDPFATTGEGDPTIYLAGSGEFGGAPGLYAFVAPPGLASGETDRSLLDIVLSPNPTAGAARLSVTPPASGALRLSVVDALGRTVAVLHDGDAAVGTALEFATPKLAPGVYTVRVEGATGARAARFTVVR